MKNNFNIVAPFYDALARLVFGYRLELAQQYFLEEVKPNTQVLIVGGGSGKILEWLPKDLNLKVDYVELSDGMLNRAMKREQHGNHISFKRKDVFEVNDSYNIIITNFFLDCFPEEKLIEVITHLNARLKEKGAWLVTDFSLPANSRQRILLWTMHTFFRLLARLESTKLQDIRGILALSGLKIRKEKLFSEQLIFSAVYRKG